jgi:hypothetical protein
MYNQQLILCFCHFGRDRNDRKKKLDHRVIVIDFQTGGKIKYTPEIIQEFGTIKFATTVDKDKKITGE